METNNVIILTGRLGRDPEVKVSPSGTKIVRLSLATNEYDFKTKSRHGVWHVVIAFDQRADYCEHYLAKGRLIQVVGHLAYNEWEKDGVKRRDAQIIVDNIAALDKEDDVSGKPATARAAASPRGESRPAQSRTQPRPQQDGYEDDIPF
jgi:single-strand DNA-binding protein